MSSIEFIFNLDTEPKEVIMNMIGLNDPETFLQMYPNAKKGEPLTRVSFAHRNMKSEEVELEEDMAPDEIERDAKKAMSQFNSDMAKIYPSSKYFARATTAPMGGGIAFEFAVIVVPLFNTPPKTEIALSLVVPVSSFKSVPKPAHVVVAISSIPASTVAWLTVALPT